MLNEPTALEACEFRAGGQCFAVAAGGVAEVIRAATLAPVPQAPEAVAGLLHLRGRIVPVIDVRTRLGLEAAGGPPRTHLVVAIADEWYSLLVDDVLDVHAIPRCHIEHPVKSFGTADAVTGVVAADGRLIHVLDPERLVQPLQKQRPYSPVRHGVTDDR